MANVQRKQKAGEGARSKRTESATQGVTTRLSEGYEQARHSVAEYPATSVLTVFAVGFGIGLVVGCALAGPAEPSAWYDRAHAEKFGRKILDSIAGMVPETLAGRLRS
jgi:hypothetical protein